MLLESCYMQITTRADAMQMLPGSNVSRAMARTGVDWICVDREHGNIDGNVVSKFVFHCGANC